MSYCFGGELEMTDKITLELTLDELKLIDKYVELNDETQSVFDKIKYAYPQPRMNLQQEGEYAVVSYHDKVYYRVGGEFAFSWYIKKGVSANYRVPTLVLVDDAETERLLEGLYYNHIQVKKEKELVRESVKWCEEHPDKDPLDWLKPQTPEQVEQGLKEAFREAVKQGVVSSTKRQTLYDVIYDWSDNVFTTHSELETKTCIDDLVDRIDKQFIPPSHDTNGYEWEKCLKMMRDNLR
jgi:hypothetical protein